MSLGLYVYTCYCSLPAPLAECKFPSYFSLLKHAFDTLHDRKGEISKIAKSVKIVMNSPEVEGSPWLERQTDWRDLVLPAIMYLSAEVGAVCSFDPLPFFYPIIEFRDRIDHWKWLGLYPSLHLFLSVLYVCVLQVMVSIRFCMSVSYRSRQRQ
jgi:hypothetical protein